MDSRVINRKFVSQIFKNKLEPAEPWELLELFDFIKLFLEGMKTLKTVKIAYV